MRTSDNFVILMSKYFVIFTALLLTTISSPMLGQNLIGESLTRAQASDGSYISWREHIIDDPKIAGFALSGSDGLVMGDIDRDGFEDIVSVHEFDAEYDSASHVPGFVAPAEGHVRVAFGSEDPDLWFNITIAEGSDAPAPEDVVVVDLNFDGYLDVVAAAELSHLIYLQNPGPDARQADWPRLILPMTQGRGSYIRVFAGDFDGDGDLSGYNDSNLDIKSSLNKNNPKPIKSEQPWLLLDKYGKIFDQFEIRNSSKLDNFDDNYLSKIVPEYQVSSGLILPTPTNL